MYDLCSSKYVSCMRSMGPKGARLGAERPGG